MISRSCSGSPLIAYDEISHAGIISVKSVQNDAQESYRGSPESYNNHPVDDGFVQEPQMEEVPKGLDLRYGRLSEP
jgi:hypothetical protein